MRDHLPVGQGRQLIRETDFTTPVRTRPGPLSRKGDLRSQKLKTVCIPCNTGWMSKIQDQTKPILSPLLLREQRVLTEADQRALAVWLAMFTMNYETTVPEYAASTIEQRMAFKEQRQPPKNWIFWCAPFDGKSSPALQTGFGSKKRSPILGDGGAKINKGCLTMCGAGAVSFAVFSVDSSDSFQAFSEFITMIVEHVRFTRLWPTTGGGIQVTDGRLSPLIYLDFVAIQDAVRDGIGVVRSRH
jgi:hypothetical protein